MQRLSPFEPTVRFTVRFPKSLRDAVGKAKLPVTHICREALLSALKKYQEEQAAKQPEKEKVSEGV